MNDPITTRAYVREVLALYPDRKFDDRKLLDSVGRLTREPLKVDELKQAVQWNHAQGYIEAEFNVDLEVMEYSLTAKGKAKEGIR